ncbi:MAG: glycosyltransferase family 39 protein [Planctomycetes bacterium]|nr:glycosyltransferase family 39 protein [Planctomycetota bacterium]
MAPAAAGTTGFTGWQWVVLLSATAVAVALRLHDLGTWSMWIDEAHTWRDATMPLRGPHGFLRSDRALYPLTFLGLRGLLALGWSADEYSLRLPFAVVGILTVPLMAFCGRRLVGPWPAVLSTWLLALDPWHIFWSQNARGYVLTCCLAAVACNRAHAYATTLRTRDLMATGAAIAIAALSHLSGALLAAGLLAFLLLRRVERLHRRSVVRAIVVAAVVAAVLPWAMREWAPIQGFLHSKDDPSLLHLLQTTAFYFRPTILLAAGAGLVFAWGWLGREKALLLGCLAAVPFYVLLVIGGQLAKVTARYAICTLPVLAWLAALACTRIGGLVAGSSVRHRGRLYPAGLALPLLLVADHLQHAVGYYTDQHGQRARWREACAFVRAEAGNQPMRVLTVNEPTIVYYLWPQHWSSGSGDADPMAVIEVLVEWKLHGIDADASGKPVVRHEPGATNHLRWHEAEAARRGAKFFVLVTMPELEEIDRSIDPKFDQPGALLRALQADYELVLHLPCWVGPKDESVYVYVPKAR